jgi:hypothetical protein
VQDARGVGGAQRGAGAGGQPRRRLEGQRPLFGQQLTRAGSRDQLRDDEVPVLIDVVHGGHVGVLDPGGFPGQGAKPGPEGLHGREVVVDHLHGHRLAQHQVARFPDLADRSGAELSGELVAVSEHPRLR